jgi:predicted nucleic acid-binding protein
MGRNLTVHLDDETVYKAKVLAARRATSLSRLVAGEIERLVDEDETYQQEQQITLDQLKQGFRLGGGRSPIRSRSMNDDRAFVNTNVLVPSYDVDAGQKHDTARSLLIDLWRSRTGAVSTQVLQEFYVTVTRKLPESLARRTAARAVVDTYRAWPVHRPSVDDVITASELEERHQLSFWDALVIVSDGQRIGELVIVNPFAPPEAD